MMLSAFRQQFQPLFEAFLQRKCREDGLLAGDVGVRSSIEYPERLAAGEGKRIRPFMAWAMYQACGGTHSDAVMRLVIGLELFHVFALVHDDVMDRGLTRHGVPTVHVAILDRLRSDGRIGDLPHAADGHAILIGDLLYQWSQEAFHQPSDIDPVARLHAADYFRRMCEEVIVGQMIDLDLTTRTEVTRDLIERKMALKTSGYTFIRPLQIGAALAGASQEILDWCELFGAALGRAFQIQDDLLDLTGSAGGIGKTVFSDLQERQHTLFTQYVRESGNAEQRKELDVLFGSRLTEDDRPRVHALFDTSGALAYGRTEIVSSLTEASARLTQSAMDPAWQKTFQLFIDELSGRMA